MNELKGKWMTLLFSSCTIWKPVNTIVGTIFEYTHGFKNYIPIHFIKGLNQMKPHQVIGKHIYGHIKYV